MQRSITALFTRSLIRRSFAPSTTTSSLLVRQLHAGRRLADEFAAAAASPSSSDGSFSGRPGRTGGRRPERLPNGVFVGGLSHTMQEDDLKRVFGRIGEVKAANVVFDRDTQRSKRFGFVYFAEPEAVQTVISDPSLVEELGPSIGVQKLEPPKNNNRSSTTRPRNEESESVFFAGFPPSMLKSDVEAAVSQFYPSSGVIDEVFLPMNRIERMEEDENFPSHDGPRHNKGYAFVRFTNKEDAREFLDKFTQAVQEEGFKFEGSRFPPTANYAKPRTQEASDGRPGGRPSRGGRGGGARAWIDEERGRYSSRGDDFRM